MFKDPIIKQLIKKYPAPKFTDRSEFLFYELIESIISQQLSIKAADTIFGRFKELFTNRHPELVSGSHEMPKRVRHDSFPTPKQVVAMEDEKLRACGLSFAKISYVKSVANAFISDLIDLEKIKEQSDEEVIEDLTQIRGVGRWTAEMILIFTLKRPDVFSIGDLGLRNAITKLYGITDRKEMLTLSEQWKPHRSTASWYLWRSLENK